MAGSTSAGSHNRSRSFRPPTWPWRPGARAAAPFLPTLPPRKPDEPGQFAFADRTRVQKILQDAGWSDVAVTPLDAECTFPERELVPYLTRVGPVGRALQEHDEPTRAAACWTLRARAAT